MDNYWKHLEEQISFNINHEVIFENGLKHTPRKLVNDINKVRGKLKALKLRKRSIIALCTDSNYAQFVIIMAVGREGHIPSPLGKFPLDNSKILFADKAEYLVTASFRDSFQFKCVKSKGKMKVHVDRAKIAMVYPTSGTSTGKSKAVFQSFLQLFHTEKEINNRMGLLPGARELIASPFDNVYWLGRLRCVLAKQGVVYFLPNPINPLSVIKALRNTEIKGLSCDTPLLKMLLDYSERSQVNIFSYLNYVKTASAPLMKSYFHKFMTSYPHAKLFYNYGLTEAMRTTILVLPDEIDGLGSSGKALNGVKIAIKVGNLPTNMPDVRGNVLIKGDNVALGYDDKLAWEEVCEFGYFNTGDIGVLDKNGFLKILGRASDALFIKDKIYFSTEIEEFIRLEYSVKSDFVIIETNIEKIPHLCLVTERNELDQSFLISMNNYLKNSKYKNIVLNRIILLKEFPRTNNGKVQHLKIKKILEKNEY